MTRVSRRGYGKPGYCKLCSWEHASELRAKMRSGANAAQAQAWAAKYGLTFNRQTFYAHRGHITARVERVVQAAELIPEAEKLREYSDEEVLRGIRDLGYANAMRDPESVNVGHALKAVQVLTAAKAQPSNVLVLIARAMTTPLESITEGEYADLGYVPPQIEPPEEPE